MRSLRELGERMMDVREKRERGVNEGRESEGHEKGVRELGV